MHKWIQDPAYTDYIQLPYEERRSTYVWICENCGYWIKGVPSADLLIPVFVDDQMIWLSCNEFITHKLLNE